MPQHRVLLLGDAIRLAYEPLVKLKLEAADGGSIEVVGPPESTGDSRQLAEHIDDLLTQYDPDAVHFNAGLEDVKWSRAERHNSTPIGEYEMNLQRVVDACKRGVGGDVIFALTTPVNDDLQCDIEGQDWDRCNREIEEYNIAAQQIMLADDVLINHLDRVIAERDDEFLAEDGVSLTETGIEAAADAVVSCIRSLWH